MKGHLPRKFDEKSFFRAPAPLKGISTKKVEVAQTFSESCSWLIIVPETKKNFKKIKIPLKTLKKENGLR